MRRILSFTDFLCVLDLILIFLRLYGAGLPQAKGISVQIKAPDRRMKSETMENKKSVKEQIRRIRAIRDSL